MIGLEMMSNLLASNNGLRLHGEQDALDVLSSGLAGCVFEIADLHPEFFELSNGIAGAALQKFSNYQYRVGIVLPDLSDMSVRVQELARDHAAHPFIRFFSTIEEAESWLSNQAR